ITKNARYGHVRGGLRTKGDRAYPPFSSRRVRPRLVTQRGRKTTPMSQASNPTVGILMGSASDWPTMQHTALLLAELGIPHEYRALSAHRTPHAAKEYAETAASRGLKVIICAAGGAAHLGGVIASLTSLPVLGVPMKGWA